MPALAGGDNALFMYIGRQRSPPALAAATSRVFTLASGAVNETLIRLHDFSDFFNYI